MTLYEFVFLLIVLIAAGLWVRIVVLWFDLLDVVGREVAAKRAKRLTFRGTHDE